MRCVAVSGSELCQAHGAVGTGHPSASRTLASTGSTKPGYTKRNDVSGHENCASEGRCSSPMRQLFHGFPSFNRKSSHWQVSRYGRQRHSGHLWPRWPRLPIAPWCHRHLRDGVRYLCTFMCFPYCVTGIQHVMRQFSPFFGLENRRFQVHTPV